MNILRGSSSGPAKRSRQTCLPPGLNRPATSASLPPGATRPASSASRHPLPSLAAVMSAPERRNMPLLHPQRPNGTLWFGIDDCIRKNVVSTYQSNIWGPWWTYRMVPDEKKVAWWTSFLQQYYWDPKHHSQEEPHQKRSKTNSENASSNPEGLGTHRHTSGSKNHKRYAYDLTVKAGGVAPPVTEVVRMTHTRKDGTFIDKRAEGFVKAAEVATNGKGRVYGLGSIQDIDDEPSETAPASLFTHVAVDGRLTTMEGVVTCLKDDVSGLKEDVIGIKRGIEVLMKMNGVDPVTFEPIQRESDASVRTPQSSQELDQNSPVH
ncbi:uncharacterized protein LOC125582943 [Brassica napus]|uniref:uncharacterized protein LOC125582943 n=1 Tax=Brassica napus TaxID=3708 RepID=UPI0020787541|nr:uncharacterized protein LOC125582943 [Brassica napus]